jgi:hypothetical protein
VSTLSPLEEAVRASDVDIMIELAKKWRGQVTAVEALVGAVDDSPSKSLLPPIGRIGALGSSSSSDDDVVLVVAASAFCASTFLSDSSGFAVGIL